MSKAANRTEHRWHKQLALNSLQFGYSQAARLGGTTASHARYWTLKFLDPTYRSKPLGGVTYTKPTFTDAELPLVFKEVYYFLKEKPTARLDDIAKHLTDMFGRKCSRHVASKVLRKMGWSWKVPAVFQLLKYTFKNLLKYAHYITEITKIPWEKLKFADEAHFVYKDLTTRGKVLSLQGERVWLKRKTKFDMRATLTILTSFGSNCPIVFDVSEDTNNQWSFTDFILDCCLNNELIAGDYLLVDNAPVHTGSDTAWLISEILDYFGVTLVYLPAYSPELNPCELVFSLVKSFIRNHHDDSTLVVEVLKALATVNAHHMAKFYRHCIYPECVLPELDL